MNQNSKKVYPHVCGATSKTYGEVHHRRGLSPRVWGNLFGSRLSLFSPGSIPTCVGQPVNWEISAACRKVYPHVCGATQR